MSHNIMYFIRRILEHYELYALFIPMFIFYFIYLKQIITIGYYYKISKHVMSFYYPIDTESFLINVFIVYPQRAAFDIFYYNHKDGLVNMLNFIFMLLVTLLLGIPLFIIRSLVLLIYTRSRSRTGSYISKYQNKTILTVDNIIVANMKSGLSNFVNENFIFTKVSESSISKCLVKTYHDDLLKKYSYHAVAFDKYTRIGVVYTTKEQDQGTCLRNLNGTYVYAQEILENDVMDGIHNEEINQLLSISGTFDVLRSHYKILTSKGIVTNRSSRQSLIQINQKMRDNSLEVINNYGGIEKLMRALDFQDNYELIIFNASKLLGDLENSSEIFRKTLADDKIRIYQQLCDYKEISLDSAKVKAISELIESFDKYNENL